MPDPDWCRQMEEPCEDVEGIYCKIKLQIEIEKDKTLKKSLEWWNRYVIANGLVGGDDGALTGGETCDGIGDDGARTGGQTGDGIGESEDRIAEAFNYVIDQF